MARMSEERILSERSARLDLRRLPRGKPGTVGKPIRSDRMKMPETIRREDIPAGGERKRTADKALSSGQNLTAGLEGPTFISRTVAQRRLTRPEGT